MRIAVIGAGPIGLEAAAAAEEAGHQAVVLEAERPGAHVRRWGHVRLFTPWRMCVGPWGRARLDDPGLEGEACPTGAELVRRYLEPLAATLDVRTGHRVVGVSRRTLRKGQALGAPARADDGFRLLLEGPEGEEVLEAGAVLDCSGVLADPVPAGAGGLPAPGEARCRAEGRLRYGPVAMDDLAGARVLLVGNGASAATALEGLLRNGDTRVTWVTSGRHAPGFISPADDPLPGRRTLANAAREALSDRRVRHHGGVQLDRLRAQKRAVKAVLTDGGEVEVDAVVACCGFRPDPSLLRELQVHLCWGTEGPMRLAAALLAASGAGGDCLDQPAAGVQALLSPEPRLFVLGNKSYGRRSDFLLQVGHGQIRDALSLLR